MGKGDRPRPVDKKKYDENFEAMFGKKELKRWSPEEQVEEVEPDCIVCHSIGGVSIEYYPVTDTIIYHCHTCTNKWSERLSENAAKNHNGSDRQPGTEAVDVPKDSNLAQG